jgi:acetyl esterase/lipase
VSFVRRHVVNLALTGNAIRPVPGERAAVPVFFAGWLTSELAPQLLALTAADTAVELARSGLRQRAGLAAAAASMAGQAALIHQAGKAADEVEQALLDGLGRRYRDELSREAAAAMSWRRLVNPFRMALPEVSSDVKLPYAPGGRRYELDVYTHCDRPAGAPVLLQVHGGGWVIGRKDQQGIPLMQHLANLGWVCVAVNYPLSPRARWPEHIIALKRAIQWIKQHAADYGGDPSFVAVTGGSAGGHLAAMLALSANDPALQPGFEDVDTTVQACVPHYGVYDFTAESGLRYTQERLDSLIRRYVMAGDAVYPDDYRGASPLFRISDQAPPFFVIHGTNDTLVPVIEARLFVERLREVSRAPVAYAELSGAQHAFDIFPSIRSGHVVRGVERFLDVVHRRWRDQQVEQVTVEGAPDGARAKGRPS